MPAARTSLQRQLDASQQYAVECTEAWNRLRNDLVNEQRLIASDRRLAQRLADRREERLNTARQFYQTLSTRLQQAEYAHAFTYTHTHIHAIEMCNFTYIISNIK